MRDGVLLTTPNVSVRRPPIRAGNLRCVSTLFLHIGLPKTGTTTLQARFADNRDALRDAGVLYPFVRPDAMFHAAVEVLNWFPRWGLDPSLLTGTWAEFCRRARQYDGRTLVSHEVFGRAQPRHIEKAMAEVGDLELHVVVTARDLSRQVTAVWQERVKNGHDYTFESFLDREGVERIAPGKRARSFFWREQDLTAVLKRWEQFVPAERIHVVTCPPPGGDPDELVRRFARVLDLDPTLLDSPRRGENSSLGAAQVDLLRRVNAALDGSIDRRDYSRVVKRFFAQSVLADFRTARATTPARLRDPLTKVTRAWVNDIRSHGWHVYGDLSDLTEMTFDETGAEPGDVPAEEVYAATPELIARLLEEVVRLSGEKEKEAAFTTPSRNPVARAARRLAHRPAR